MIILKILLWILLIILIVLAVLGVAFAFPVGVCFSLDEKPKLAVKYLFLKIPIPLEPDEEKERKKAEKEEKKRQKELIKAEKQKKKELAKSERENKKAENKPTQKRTVNKTKEEKKSEAEKKDKKNKKTKKEKKPKKENKTLKKLKALWKQRGLEGIVELIKEIAKIVGGLLSSVFKNIVIRKLDLNITVAYEDAADTAIKYGYACSGIYPAMAVILRIFKYKDYNIIIIPDFDKKANEISVDAEISIVPWFVIAGAVKAAFRLLKMKISGMI